LLLDLHLRDHKKECEAMMKTFDHKEINKYLNKLMQISSKEIDI